MSGLKKKLMDMLEISEFKNQLLNHQSQIEMLQSQIFEYKRKNEELSRKLTETRKKADDLNSKVVTLARDVKHLKEENHELKGVVHDHEQMMVQHWGGLNVNPRSSRLIVSLTSFPERIQTVSFVIERMLLQTMKPDLIVLWLSKLQFEHQEQDLPNQLLELKKYGVEIRWCDHDLKAYKKFIDAVQVFHDDLLILIDDDLNYDIDLVEKLYCAHQQFPDSIIASRVHEVGRNEKGEVISYSLWKKQCTHDCGIKKHDWFFTGGAGTLIPVSLFDYELTDVELIKKLCPYADDIWLNIHTALKHIPIVNIAANSHLRRIEDAQTMRLQDINWKNDETDKTVNDIQLQQCIHHYHHRLIDTVYEKIEK